MRSRILREARTLIRQRGFWGTSVQDITEAADVAPATFFNHFPSKAALVRELASDLFEECFRVLADARQRPGSTAERLAFVLDCAAVAVAEAHETLPTQLLAVVRLAAVSESPQDRRAHLQRGFSALLYDGQARGDVRRDIDAGFLAEMVAGAFLAAILSWLNDPRFPLNARLKQTAAFLGDAFRTGTAHAAAHPPTGEKE